MLFNSAENGATISVQQEVIPVVKNYKYQGVTLNDKDYLDDHEDYLRLKGRLKAGLMKQIALWGFNKYEMVRGVWKGVMVPALPLLNAVRLRSEIKSGLEVNGRSVGRIGLGAHSKTTNEAVQGDMSWASFQAREAQTKIRFEERLRNMDDQRRAARVRRYPYLKSVNTHWRKGAKKVAAKYRTIGNTETIRQILMDFESIHPVRSGGNGNFLQALVFRDNGDLDRSSVEISKRRLECRWKKTMEQTGLMQSQQ